MRLVQRDVQIHTHTHTPTPPHTHTPADNRVHRTGMKMHGYESARVWKRPGMKMNGYETSGYRFELE